MKLYRSFMLCIGIAMLALSACSLAQDVTTTTTATTAAKRIGVYDSRSITVAYGGSSYMKDRLQQAQEDMRKAQEANDTKRMTGIENEMHEWQKEAHRQAFSTAPVDKLLEKIKDKIPEIERKAGVETIVSKWDKDALARYGSAERVDVTMDLVRAFEPTEKQLKSAEDIQKHDPIPLEELEKHLAGEGKH